MLQIVVAYRNLKSKPLLIDRVKVQLKAVALLHGSRASLGQLTRSSRLLLQVKDMFSTAADTLAAAVEASRISYQIAAESQSSHSLSSVQPRWPVLSSILPVQDLVDARAATLAEF